MHVAARWMMAIPAGGSGPCPACRVKARSPGAHTLLCAEAGRTCECCEHSPQWPPTGRQEVHVVTSGPLGPSTPPTTAPVLRLLVQPLGVFGSTTVVHGHTSPHPGNLTSPPRAVAVRSAPLGVFKAVNSRQE